MWPWMALMAFFLIVFLVTKAVVRSQGGIQHVGLQQGYDVSLSGGAATDGAGWVTPARVGLTAALLATVAAGDPAHSARH